MICVIVFIKTSNASSSFSESENNCSAFCFTSSIQIPPLYPKRLHDLNYKNTFLILPVDRPVFPVRIKPDMVPHFRHLTVKVFQGKGLADCFIHCLPCHVVPCGHPILFRLIKCIGFLSAAWMFYDRKSIFPTQLIGALAKQSKIGFVVVVMFPVHKRNRVHNKVIVKAVRIQMSSNDYGTMSRFRTT